MANKVVIDVEARFTDNISSGVKSAQKAIDALGKSVDELQGKLNGAGMKIPSTPSLPSPPGQKTPSAPSQKSSGKKTYKPIFDADNSRFLRKIRDMEAKAQRLGHTKTAMVLEAVDKATNVIGKVMNAAQKFGHLTAEAALKVNDMGMRVVQKTSSALRSVTSKVWTTTLRVKDFVTAPIRKLKESLFSVKNLVAAIATGLAFKQFVMEPVGMYRDYENLVTQFSVLLGSEDAAKKRMQSLVDFAGKTPFTRDEIFQASKVLQTYTGGALATPDATGGLKMIGDVAAATGEDYTRVANYFGRLYNEVKRGGKSMGEPLMMLREIGALSADAEEKITEIAQGSGTIEQKWEQIAQQFSQTDGMMEAMSNQMGNLITGVKAFVKNNLWMKLGEGISASLKPFLSDFRRWRNENGALISEWATKIKDTAQILSGKVLGAVRTIASKVQEIMKTPEWAEAGFGGKAKLLWKGLIADPLTEWWTNGGREKTIQAAGKIGAEAGSLLSKALLGLFRGIGLLTGRGSDLAGAGMEAGSSVAGAFVQGFLANFDGAAVAGAFKDALLGIWDAMPTWGKILAGVMAGNKIFGAGAKVLGGVKGFWGSAGEVVDEAGNVLDVVEGASGLRGLIGHAGRWRTDEEGNRQWIAGSGLGKLGTMVYQKFGGAGAAGLIESSPVLASGLGLAGVAGAVAGGATAIKGGYDVYKGIREGDEVKRNSGLTKLGGVGAGALIGFTLGGPLGAAIGAGVGGIAGWLNSSHYEKSMKAANFESQEMKDAIQDSAMSAEELDRTFQKVVAQNLEDHFGDIRLSMDELARLSDQLVWGDDKEAFEKFTSAAEDAHKSLTALNNAGKATEKWMWKASLGVKFDETEQGNIKESFQSYIDSAQSYIENQHYTFTAAVGVLFEPEDEGGKGILESGGKWYSEMEGKAKELGGQLQEKIETALKGDGIITDQEWEAIMHVQVQIDDVTSEVSEAEEQARRMMMESMFKGGKLHLSGGAMDATSYQRLMEMNSTNIGEKQTGYYDTAVKTLEGIQGAYNAGDLTEDKRTKQITDTYNQYKSQIAGLRAETMGFQVELISDTYAQELGEGAATKVWTGLNDALQNKTDPIKWSDEQVRSLLELPSEVPQEAVENLRTMLSTAFGQINPLEVDDSLLDSWLNFNPEAWDNLDPMDVERTVNETYTKGEIDTSQLEEEDPLPELPTIDMEQPVNLEFAPGFSGGIAPDSSPFSNANLDRLGILHPKGLSVDVPVNTTYTQGTTDTSQLAENPAEGLVEDKTVDQTVTTNTTVVNGSGDTSALIQEEVPASVSATSTLSVNVGTQILGISDIAAQIKARVPRTVTATTTLSVSVGTQISGGGGGGQGYARRGRYRGGIVGGPSAMESYARGGIVGFSDGGIVRGGSRLIQVAEEGSPEMVIPLSSQRRDRGRKLWEKAGHMLKVPGFARGGLTDGSPMDERPFGSKGKLGSILQRIDALVEKLLTTKTQNIAKELQSLGQGGNVDLLNRPIVDASILRDVGWDDTGEGKATVFSSTFSDEAGTKAINFTPIIVDQQGSFIDVLEPGSLAEYAEGVIQGVQDDYLSLQIGAAFTGDDAIQQAESAAERIHSLQEEYYLSPHLNTNRKLGDLLRIPDLFSAGRTSLPNVWQTSSAMTDDRFGVRVEDDPIPRRERHPRAIPYNSPEEILQSGTRSTSEAAAGPGDVHVEMGGITVNLTIQVNGGGNVVDEIKAQMGEIRDAVADALTDSLGAGFANTPLRGGLAG